MKEIQDIRRMLEQLTVGTISSHTNAVSFILKFYPCKSALYCLVLISD